MRQTHNVALTAPVAEWVVSLSLNGVLVQGSVGEIIAGNSSLAAQVAEQEKVLRDAEETQVKPADEKILTSSGKLVVAEGRQEGRVKWPACRCISYVLCLSPTCFSR